MIYSRKIRRTHNPIRFVGAVKHNDIVIFEFKEKVKSVVHIFVNFIQKSASIFSKVGFGVVLSIIQRSHL